MNPSPRPATKGAAGRRLSVTPLALCGMGSCGRSGRHPLLRILLPSFDTPLRAQALPDPLLAHRGKGASCTSPQPTGDPARAIGGSPSPPSAPLVRSRARAAGPLECSDRAGGHGDAGGHPALRLGCSGRLWCVGRATGCAGPCLAFCRSPPPAAGALPTPAMPTPCALPLLPGLAALVALAALLYTLPWRRAPRGAEPGSKATMRGFNLLWRGRAVLSALSALWAVRGAGLAGACSIACWAASYSRPTGSPAMDGTAAARPTIAVNAGRLAPACTRPQLSPLLRVSSLWGANSLLFGRRVTAWTGAGWMCRCAGWLQSCSRLLHEDVPGCRCPLRLMPAALPGARSPACPPAASI